MNKKIKYFIGIYILLFSFLNAQSIKKYDINLKLLQSGELRVSENILYDFATNSKHGIYRDIPYTINLNGFNRNIGLYNFKVYQDNKDANYIKKKVNNNLSGKNIRIKIGDENKIITGEHRYKIDYGVKLGVLNKDEKYDITSWNLIGNEWKYPIENIKAIITLPESLSQDNTLISTFSGKFGKRTTSATIKWIDDNHFEVSITHLSAHEGLTVNILYPVNTLGQSGKKNENITLMEKLISMWHWLAILIITLFNYIYLKIFATNKFETSIYPKYNPPKNLSILQLGVLYDKFANHKNLSPAIIELAQKGYLTIQKAKDTTTVSKLQKDSSNLSDDMQYLLNDILFNNRAGDFEFKNINNNLYEWTYDKEYMKTNPKKSRNNFLITTLLLSVILMVVSFFTSVTMVGEYSTFSSLVNLIFVVVFLYYLFFSSSILHKFIAIFLLVVSQIIFLEFFTELLLSEFIYTPLSVGSIIAVTTFYTYKRVGKYTMQGVKIKNHLDGFSRFISRVKTNEVKRKLKHDPLYLDKYLPYAILFGHSKHWLSFYTKLDIESPSWYFGELNKISEIIEDLSNNTLSYDTDKIFKRMEDISDMSDDIFSSSRDSQSSSGGNYSGGDSSGGGGGDSW